MVNGIVDAHISVNNLTMDIIVAELGTHGFMGKLWD